MRFVTLIRFSSQGLRDIRHTRQRAQQFQQESARAGIKIQEILWTQGRFDGLILFEAPEVESALAAMLGLSSQGNVTTETLVAFDGEGIESVLARR